MRRLAAAPLVLVLALAPGCSGGGDDEPAAPRAADFAEGACRDAAPAVLDAGRLVRGVDGDAPSPEDREGLRAAQDGVVAALPQAPAELAPPLQDLVASLGFARVQLDTGRLTGEVRDRVLTAYDAVVRTCTEQG